MGWQWSATARSYTDESTGDAISNTELASLQADFVAKMQTQFRDAATTLHNDGAAPDAWEATLRPIVDRTQAISFQLSRGGANAMTSDDWSAVETQIAAQYDFLQSFAADAGTGQLSEAEAAARAASYATSGNTAASYGRQATYAGLELPAHPGQGSECLSQCGCFWNISETKDSYEATWSLTKSRNCPTCLSRASEYSPYRQSKATK